MAITHKKISLIASTSDPNLVQPADWNNDHSISGTLDLTNTTGIVGGIIPNTPLAFSATPNFPVTINASYSMTLTGNVTSSTTSGTPVNGQLLSLTLTEDGVGGRSFVFPGNFVFTPTFTFVTTASAINELTFKFDGTNWHLISNVGTGGGGGVPNGNNGDLQMKAGAAFNSSAINDNGTTLAASEDFQFKGPNPWIDIRAYGARSGAGATTTCTATAGLPNVTIGAASTFVNGDGVVCRGAGASITLSTPGAPTVTPSLSATATGTGVTVAGPAGATTYQYQIVALTQDRGYTIAGTAGTTATGAASLGSQSNTISSWTRTNNIVTINTSSTHGLAVSAQVQIGGGTGTDGVYRVLAVNSTTQFTITTGLDTRNGATASGGAVGTVYYYNVNKITWTAVANAYQYIIYGRTSGSMVPLGFSYPTNNPTLTNVATYLEYEDYGATMSTPGGFPDWVPNTPPVAVKNGDLVSTIVSGAGTTSLVLANNAGNNTSATTFKLDHTPNIIAAANAAVGAGRGVMYIPQGSFVTNSVMQLPTNSNLSVIQAGGLSLNDTMIVGLTQWTGRIEAQGSNRPSFGAMALPQITTGISGNAYPMVYSVNPQMKFSYVNFESFAANQSLLYLADTNGSIPGDVFDYVYFQTSGSSDYLTLHVVVRGNSGTAKFVYRDCLFVSGPNQVTGNGLTPLVYFDGGTSGGGVGGEVQLINIFFSRRSFVFRGGILLFTAKNTYEEGGLGPVFTFDSSLSGTTNINGTIDSTILDTFSGPLVAVLNPALLGEMTLSSFNGGSPVVSGYPALSYRVDSVSANAITNFGQNTGVSTSGLISEAIDGVFNTQSAPYPIEAHNSGMAIGTSYKAFVSAAPQAAPTCTVSAGGTLAVNSYTFVVAPVFVDGGEGALSPGSTTCTTSTGNQTITINWTLVPGAIGYDLYKTVGGVGNGYFSIQCTPPLVSGGSTLSYVWSGQAACGVSAPVQGASGPVLMNSSEFASPTFKVTGGNGGGVVTVTAPTLTANRTQSAPDVSGTQALSTGTMTNQGHILKTRGDGTIQDAGVPSSSIFDGFNRANGSITAGNSNWTVLAGTLTITSNAVSGGTSVAQNYAIYSGSTFLSDDQNVASRFIATGSQGNALQLLLRFQNNVTLNGYTCATPSTTGTNFVGSPTINKWVAGTFSTLATGTSGTWPSGTTFSCNAVGSIVTMYADGVQIVQSTGDVSFSSGFVGIAQYSNSTSIAFDDFWASIGGVSLNIAQNWNAIQNFVSGVQLNGSNTLTSVSGNSGKVAQSSGTLTSGDFASIDANGNIVDSGVATNVLNAQLSSITPASTSNTIANGDNAQVWNWALTTAGKQAFKFGESAAATGGNQTLLQVGTIAGSTAVPLNVFGNLSGSQTLPTLSITPTWNTTGVVDAALLVNPTNTASGTGSLLADFQLSSTTQWKLDKAGNTTQLGTASMGSNSPACTPGTAGGTCLNEGTAPSAGAWDNLYADSTQHAISVNNNNTGNMPVSRITCVNVTPVTVNANVSSDQNLMSCTLAANTLNVVGRTLRITTSSLYTTPAASVATITNKVKLCTVSGCGSGTVVTLASYISTANPGTVTNNSVNTSTVSTVQTAGASSAHEAHGQMVIDLGASPTSAATTFTDTNAATQGTIDSTAQLFLQITGTFSVASASNSMSQRQLLVEVLN